MGEAFGEPAVEIEDKACQKAGLESSLIRISYGSRAFHAFLNESRVFTSLLDTAKGGSVNITTIGNPGDCTVIAAAEKLARDSAAQIGAGWVAEC